MSTTYTAMTDKVEDMPGAAAQGAQQIIGRLAGKPDQFDQPLRLERLHGCFQTRFFLGDIEPGQVAGIDTATKNTQRRRHRQRLDSQYCVHVLRWQNRDNPWGYALYTYHPALMPR